MKYKKKKLLIFTGAGASIEFGMHSVSNVDLIFETIGRDLMPLAAAPDSSLYSFIKNEIIQYYNTGAHPKETNFEELLYVINLLSAIYSDSKHTYPLNALLNRKTLPEIIVNGNRRAADSTDLKMLHSHLVDTLLSDFRNLCLNASVTKTTELRTLAAFLETLKEEFDIAVVTVNYDDIFLQADPSLQTGFDHSGNFDPIGVINNNWNFYYSLHGSVHFDMKLPAGTGSLHEISWEQNLSTVFQQNSSGRNTITTMEGLHLLTSNIIAGYDKSNQILRNPFKTYFSQIPKIINEADCFLFCGYGFGDKHLNSHLEDVRRGSTPKKVVILDWASDDEDPLQFRQDTWSWEMAGSLIVDQGSMGTKTGRAAPFVADLKRNKEFEISYNPALPLAVWYDGFLSACRNAPKVIAELI